MCEIAYQNKDITLKLFAERFQGKSLKIYGLDPPPCQAGAADILDVGCLKLETQSAFLSEMDSEEISDRLPLSEEELMEFIILPLTYKGKDEKNKSISRSADMANQIEDEEQRVFILSGIAVFADKVIGEENMNMISILA